MLLVVPLANVEKVTAMLESKNEKVFNIGKIVKSTTVSEKVVLNNVENFGK